MNSYHQGSLRVNRSTISYALLLFALNSCARSQTPATAEHHGLTPRIVQLARDMKDVGDEHIHMPPLPLAWDGARYINTTPEYLRDSLKGKVVLIDIWDYTCVNCIQTLPYIKAWNERYKNKGLVILGVHAPEFAFEKEIANLDSAVRSFGLTYPVLADNDYEIWNALANQYWPAKYLFDAKGILRAEHFGEGEYESFEAFMQKILLERDSSLAMPEPLSPVSETDKPGAVCYRPTPETYIGFARSHLGFEVAASENKAHSYQLPKTLETDRLYLDGEWIQHREYAVPANHKSAALVMNYQAKDVNLVAHPLAERAIQVWVEQDGLPVPKEDRGADLQESGGKTFFWVRNPRMYNLISNKDFRRHTFRISSDSPDIGAYAFTFTTACQKP